MTETTQKTLESWLQSIGAEECLATLQAADVDLSLVRDLSEADLRELGLTLGQRKRLSKGIERLRAVQPASSRAERRQLSFLFCDLVGSTEFARQMDAEDWGAAQQTYHRLAAAVAERWGGRLLAQYGDGCLAVFGHPIVHEDDAARAVRAGLDMVREVADLGPYNGRRLNARVAVATGRVVIGDMMGGADPNSVAGETPNLAARLQDVAQPGTVVIAPSTRRLVSRAFDLDPMGPRQLKGFSEQVEVWTVRGARETADIERAPAAPNEVVGRERELATLREAWAKAVAGHPQIVLLEGEPGMGKSWLTSAFAAEVAGQTGDLRRHRHFCTAYKTNTALHPFLAGVARLAGIKGEDRPEKVRRRIAACEAVQAIGSDGATQLLSAQLGADDQTHPLDMNAAQQKVAMFRLLFDMMTVEETHGPLLSEIEDAHWADPTTLELLAGIATSPPPIRLMIIVTHRPGFDVPWADLPWVTRIRLGRLSMIDAMRLARRNVPVQMLPDARLRDIVAKADGVPLYVEELTRTAAMMERDSVGSDIQVPDTLEDSLMARLDRLGEAKAVAQVAATIGRRFRLRLLAQAAGRDQDSLRPLVARLVEADILFRAPDLVETYVFRHALIQDAAYASLLRSERRELHGRIAALITELTQDSAMTEPEILARHYAGAEMPVKAVEKLIEAGRAATARGAQVEANNHYRAALDLMEHAPRDAASTLLHATVQAQLGQSLLATLGWAAPEVGEAFERARALSASCEDAPMLLASTYGVWAVAASRGEKDKASKLAAEAVQQFGASGVPLFELTVHFMDGVTLLYQGDLFGSEVALNKALALYDPAMHDPFMQIFGDDFGSFAMIYLMWNHALRGDFATSGAFGERDAALAVQLGDRQLLIRGKGFTMSGLQLVGMVDMAHGLSEELIAQATEQCYPYWVAVASLGRGWCLCHKGQAEEGLAAIEGALGFFDMIGQRTPLSLVHTYYGEALLQAGQHARALVVMDQAIATCRSALDALYLPDLIRLRGESLAPTDPTAAEAALREAIAEARDRSMGFFELRAAVSLARLLAGTPRAAGALEILREAKAKIQAPAPLPILMESDALLAAAGD